MQLFYKSNQMVNSLMTTQSLVLKPINYCRMIFQLFDGRMFFCHCIKQPHNDHLVDWFCDILVQSVCSVSKFDHPLDPQICRWQGLPSTVLQSSHSLVCSVTQDVSDLCPLSFCNILSAPCYKYVSSSTTIFWCIGMPGSQVRNLVAWSW